jgi:hypothetical protein
MAEDWEARARAAEAELAQVRAELDGVRAKLKARTTRKRRAPLSDDARLIADVCAAFTLNRGELAERLGLTSGAVLSRAQRTPLPDRLRDELKKMHAERAKGSEE